MSPQDDRNPVDVSESHGEPQPESGEPESPHRPEVVRTRRITIGDSDPRDATAPISPAAPASIPEPDDLSEDEQRMLDMASRVSLDAVGDVVGGRYEIVEKLGQGGMGVVFRARERELERDVAIKRLQARERASKLALERFFREARAIAKLNHRNIVSVYALDSDSKGAFIAMEYVDGKDLGETIAERGALKLPEALEIIEAVGSALAYAHRNQVFHRDVKPSNIILDVDGVPKIVDFGLAKVGHDTGVSRSGEGLGTLAYMAPEQISDAKNADQRADIFSLAKTLYHALTGERPETPDLDRLPLDLQAAVRRALEARPARRQFSVEDFLRDLRGDESVRSTGGPSLNTTKCPNCSTENVATSRYCRACGAGLRQECPKCKHQEEVGARHCSSCGLDLSKHESALQAIARARRLIKSHQYAEALDVIDAGLATGHEPEALQDLRDEAQRKHDELERLLGPARAWMEKGEFDRAQDALTRTRRQMPARLMPLLEALATEIVSRRESALIERYQREAEEHERSGRLEEAILYVQRCANLRPRDARYRAALDRLRDLASERKLRKLSSRVRMLAEGGRLQQALDELASSGDLADGRYGGRYQALRDHVRQVGIDATLARAERALRKRNVSKARTLLKDILRETPDHAAARSLSEKVARVDDEKRREIERYRALRETSGIAISSRAAERLSKRFPSDPDVARIVLEERERRRDLTHERDRARSLADSGAHVLAAGAWRRILELDPGNEEAERGLALAQRHSTRRAWRRRIVLAAAFLVIVGAGVPGWMLLTRHAEHRLSSIEARAQNSRDDPTRIASLRGVVDGLWWIPAARRSETKETLRRIEAESRIGAALDEIGAADPADDGGPEALAVLPEWLPHISPERCASLGAEIVAALEGRLLDLIAIEPASAGAFAARCDTMLDTLACGGSPLAMPEGSGMWDPWLSDRDMPGPTSGRRMATLAALAECERLAASIRSRAHGGGIAEPVAALERISHVLESVGIAGEPARSTLGALASELATERYDAALGAVQRRDRVGPAPIDDLERLLAYLPGDWALRHETLTEARIALERWHAARAYAPDREAPEALALGVRSLADGHLEDAGRRFRDLDATLSAELRDVVAQVQPVIDTIGAHVERFRPREARQALEALADRPFVVDRVLEDVEWPASLDASRTVESIDARIRAMERRDAHLPGGLHVPLVYLEPEDAFPVRDGWGSEVRTAPVGELYMSVTEITRAQWIAAGMTAPDLGLGVELDPRLPVSRVTLEMVDRFLAELNARDPLGGVYRLPTLAEWQHACRGRPADDTLQAHAWLDTNSGNDGHPRPTDTARRNEAGLADMLGNVREIVSNGSEHLTCGGAFNEPAGFCEPFDQRIWLGSGDPSIGFRVVWVPPPPIATTEGTPHHDQTQPP